MLFGGVSGLGLLCWGFGCEFLIFLFESLDHFGQFLVFYSQYPHLIFHRLILFLYKSPLRIFQMLSILCHQINHLLQLLNYHILLTYRLHHLFLPMGFDIGLMHRRRFNIRMGQITLMSGFLTR